MGAAGCTVEEIAGVIEGLEVGPTGTPRQERNRRYYEARKGRLKASETVLIKTPDEASESVLKASETVLIKTPLARVEDNPSTIELSGKKDKNLGRERLNQTPREILLGCLSPEIADGVLAHRKAMRRPLTGRAAQLLAKGFLATADPNAAADMMIERGWQGFKPEWFDNERRTNGQGNRQGKGSIVEAGRRLTARLIAAEREGELQAERGFREGDDAFRVLPGGLSKRP